MPKELSYSDGIVPSIGNWATNAEMIADIGNSSLPYLEGRVLDLSYNEGKFWTSWKPIGLTTNDLDPQWETDFHHDVELSPPEEWLAHFDCVVWDGPYRLSGGRDRARFDSAYGLREYRSAKEILALLKNGVGCAYECCVPGGHVLVKCMDQVNAGRKVWQSRILADHGESLGMTLCDKLTLVSQPRAQPSGRRVLHSRTNYSDLLIFRKEV